MRETSLRSVLHQACTVSVVIPAFNEAERVPCTIKGLVQHLNKLVPSYEIIVVDDGSTDATAAVVAGLNEPAVRVIRLEHNRGKGAALRRGSLDARGEVVFFADADLPYSLDFFNRALPLLQDGIEVVIGARDLPGSALDSSYPNRRIWMGKVFSRLVNILLPIGVFDTQCGFKGFRQAALSQALLFSSRDDYTLDIELLLLVQKWRMSLERIPVKLERHHGSKIRLVRDSVRMLVSLLAIAWQYFRGTYPLTAPADGLEEASCPACGSSLFHIHALLRNTHRFCRCSSCGTLYQNPRLSADRVQAQYQSDYFRSNSVYSGYPDYSCTQDYRRQTAGWLCDQVERMTGGTVATMLDVGCGSGEVLKEARNRSKECWGNDIWRQLEAEDGHFIGGDFVAADLPTRYFDLVVFNDSFEHFADPTPVLHRCRELLREGAFVLINTPDPDSWLARVSGRSWISLKDEHLVVYPRRVIKRLLQSEGFGAVQIAPSFQHVDWKYIHERLRETWPILAPISRLIGAGLGSREFRVRTGGMLVLGSLNPRRD
jgi:dolichyl-phosphate beta-glucosyltransferase